MTNLHSLVNYNTIEGVIPCRNKRNTGNKNGNNYAKNDPLKVLSNNKKYCTPNLHNKNIKLSMWLRIKDCFTLKPHKHLLY